MPYVPIGCYVEIQPYKECLVGMLRRRLAGQLS